MFRVPRAASSACAAPCRWVDRESLSLAYTPGVAEVCTAIHADGAGAAVHLAVAAGGGGQRRHRGARAGQHRPLAALPVMEGKAALFSEFAGLNAVPIVLATTEPDEIVETVDPLAPSFGGINLEDIRRRAASRSRRGCATASTSRCSTTTSTAPRSSSWPPCATRHESPAASSPTCAWSCPAPVRRAWRAPRSCWRGDRRHRGRRLARHRAPRPRRPDAGEGRARRDTNRAGLTGSLDDALAGADVFFGISAGAVPRRLSPRWRRRLSCSRWRTRPEIDPAVAHRYAAVVATGRSDYPNQINNVLAFPGVFAGAFDAGARRHHRGDETGRRHGAGRRRG